ncbi:guanitoxin biosynthesis pre-guanitoxin forming N-methyltransferase GntF [Nostoc sp.]|uniref:guanitoxin biosynthesis pre-guanitoxin forming N-methyltransferase GntF n=1 Tax=Nostoc sp. TaxID=1180 RepID=UPI002FFC7996
MQLKFKENDFQSFEPIPYLNEYFDYPSDNYGGVGIENEQFLQFFAQVAHEHNLNNSLLLDFGCGPTIYSIVSLGNNCREIHMSDYLQQNLDQVKLWQQGNPQVFDWNPYLRRALQMETALNQNKSTDSSLNITDEQVQQRATLLQQKITSIRQGNARAINPVGEEGKALYEAVVSSFCLEGVAEDVAEWKKLITNLSSTIKLGGLLIFATQIEADSYRIGDGYGTVVNLSEEYIVQTLLDCNFEPGSIKTKQLNGGLNHTEYEKFLMLTARLAF